MISISHCTYSQTLRQMPENYVLASFKDNRWIMEPDLAADKGIVVALTLSLMEHSHKWDKNPANAIMGMAPHFKQ